MCNKDLHWNLPNSLPWATWVSTRRSQTRPGFTPIPVYIVYGLSDTWTDVHWLLPFSPSRRHIKNSPHFFFNLFIVLALDNTVEYHRLKPMRCVVMVPFLSKLRSLVQGNNKQNWEILNPSPSLMAKLLNCKMTYLI